MFRPTMRRKRWPRSPPKPRGATSSRRPKRRRTGQADRHGGASPLGAADDPLAIDHPTLGAVVAERLRQLITDGTLVPGVWLNEARPV
ncbi:hypothetical protein ACU4GD_09300 [Cupriavidus basilensis]